MPVTREDVAILRANDPRTPLAVTPVTAVTPLTGGASELLEQVGDVITRYVVLPDPDAWVAVCLFVLHTWAIEAAHATPYLAVVSAEKQSGKTRLIEVLSLIVRQPWHTASTTEAALFRKIEVDTPTLLLDEIDAIFGSNTERTEPLRAALNAGNRRGACVARVIGQGSKMEVADFSVFCPKVLAGIDTGRLPETIADRSVMLHMKRRTEGETVERLRYRFAVEETEPLRDSLRGWAAGAVDHLREVVPGLPDGLGDRAADSWEPLLAIADMAGGLWPDRARAAAIALSTPADNDEVGRGPQLLNGIRTAMAGSPHITTADLLTALNEDEELPFGGWRDGKGLDARILARLLKPYTVKPRTIRVGEGTAKGYRAEDLADAWARYLPAGDVTGVTTSHPEPVATAVTPVTPVTGNATNGHHDADPDSLRAAVQAITAMPETDAERAYARLIGDPHAHTCKCGKELWDSTEESFACCGVTL
jgi:hypothetical protein